LFLSSSFFSQGIPMTDPASPTTSTRLASNVAAALSYRLRTYQGQEWKHRSRVRARKVAA